MKSPLRSLCFFISFFIFTSLHIYAQHIAINEVMAANSSTIADEFGDYEDWIELYNYGTKDVNLEGFGLSDDITNPFRWIFPAITMSPGEYLLVWASGRDLKPDGEWKNGLMREVYTNIPGTTISSLINHSSYPDNPTERYISTGPFDAPVNIDDNYGQRMHSYIEAPQTGGYVFWIASDDNGLLSLSPDENPSNAQDIASVPGWTRHMEWDKYSTQQSGVIMLEQGQRYYIRALMKEGLGGDNLSVQWQLPSGVIESPIPASRLFWRGGQLHTNFSISSQGEKIVLTRPDSVIVDQMASISLPSGISYGRYPDGIGGWYYFDQPTPGQSNKGQKFDGVTATPFFSSPGGFYREDFELDLYHSDKDVKIYYTLDGSEPSESKLGGSTYQYKKQYRKNQSDQDGGLISRSYITHEYSEPFMVTDRTGKNKTQTEINSRWEQSPVIPHEDPLTGTVVRARAVKEGYIASEIVSSTYIFKDKTYSVPVVSLVLPEKYFFSYHDGIYVPGKAFDDWRTSNWGANVQGNSPANFQNRGKEWEREVNVEFFDTLGNLVINQRAGARIHGGWSRSHPQKSIRLYARNAYGTPEFKHQFFPEKETDTFKRILMRASGNDQFNTFFRDAFIQRLVKNRPIDIQHWQPAVTFINGEYWGILNIRDRNDKYYLAHDYGFDPDKLDILAHNGSVKQGDNIHYWTMMNYVRDNDMSDSLHFEVVNTMMDTDNYAEYFAIQIYANNQDWPHNNIDFWRYKTDSFQPDARYGHDGRWRWLLYDTDFGFWIWNNGPWENTLAHATRDHWSTELFRHLLQNQEFRDKMVNRFADHMNTVFQPDTILALVSEMQQVYEPIMDDHISRWHRISSRNQWIRNIDKMRDYAQQRPEYIKGHIQEYFNLDGNYQITLNIGSGKGSIRINTIEIDNPSQWNGVYFNGVPIEIEAIPAKNYSFSHWEGTLESSSNIQILESVEDIFMEAHFRKSDKPVLIAYWLFDESLPNNVPMETVGDTYHANNPATIIFQSALQGYPFYEGHIDWRRASMERRNMPTEINYRREGNTGVVYTESNMRGLQVKPPFSEQHGENTLIFSIPTNGYSDVVFSFAAINENAADTLLVDYAIDNGQLWLTDGLAQTSLELLNEYQLYQISFTEITESDDNPYFKIRIRFGGVLATDENASRVTFNNFSLDGIPLDSVNFSPQITQEVSLKKAIEDGDPITINLNHIFNDPEGDLLSFTAVSNHPEIVQVQLDNHMLTLLPIKRGDAQITITASDEFNPSVEQRFRVLVYPQAHRLQEGNFLFTGWGADNPESTYPQHMIFLQSDTSDPGLSYPLLFPYHIPIDEYHAEDQINIDFPYNNTRRTRINGLGEEGLSLINTGRGRDLGGVLVAVNTKDQKDMRIKWTAETLLRNERLYAIRLLYRIGTQGAFRDVVFNGKVYQYLAGADGDSIVFPVIDIPHEAMNQEYVQFLWKYYHIAGDSGARSQLRLDDIIIGDLEPEDDVTVDSHDSYFREVRVFPNPAKTDFNIVSGSIIKTVDLYDITGKLMYRDEVHGHEKIIHVGDFKSGMYFLRTYTVDGVEVSKLVISTQ